MWEQQGDYGGEPNTLELNQAGTRELTIVGTPGLRVSGSWGAAVNHLCFDIPHLGDPLAPCDTPSFYVSFFHLHSHSDSAGPYFVSTSGKKAPALMVPITYFSTTTSTSREIRCRNPSPSAPQRHQYVPGNPRASNFGLKVAIFD